MLPGRTNFRVKVYPPNQAHEAAVGMSRLHEKRWEGSIPDVAAAQGGGNQTKFSLYQTGRMGQHLKIMVAR